LEGKMRSGLCIGFVALLVSAISACSSSEDPLEVDPPDASEPSGPRLEPPGEGEGFQFTMLAHIPVGTESEKCKFVQLGPEGIHVQRTESLYTAGSHHMLLFLTSYEEIPTENRRGEPVVHETDDGVFDCSRGPTADWDVTSVVGGAQNPASELYDLPDGVAVFVPGGSVLLLNTHYLNSSGEDLDAEVFVNLWTIPADQVHTRAGMLFFYNPFIFVPQRGEASARYVCPVTQDVTIVNAQSHMHARGVGYEAFLVDGSWAPVGDGPIYTETSWGAPVVEVFPSGGLDVTAGHFIDYRCDYANDEDHDIYQGLSANDEMCMFIGAYYPYNGPLEFCAPNVENFNAFRYQAGTSVGNGEQLCGESLQVVLENGFGPAMMEALTQTCPSHAQALKAAYTCAGTAQATTCATECSTDPADCNDCVQATCGAELQACAELATCE
jgi:hypothetical protein